MLGSAEPRTAIILPPAPIVNKAKEELLEFEHSFASGLVALFTGDLRTEVGALDDKLRKNISNSTMPTYARPAFVSSPEGLAKPIGAVPLVLSSREALAKPPGAMPPALSSPKGLVKPPRSVPLAMPPPP